MKKMFINIIISLVLILCISCGDVSGLEPPVLWETKIIEYKFEKDFEKYPDILIFFLEFFMEVETRVGIKFVEVKTDKPYTLNIYIGHNIGYSTVGKKLNPHIVIPVNIKRRQYGVMAHECLHTLGMWHEHQRPDVEDNLIIFWDRIIKKRIFNYNTLSSDYFPYDLKKYKYDYNSIMHYSSYPPFTKDGEPVFLKKYTGKIISNKCLYPSDGDWAKLKAMYNKFNKGK